MLPRVLLFLRLAVPVAAVFAAGCGDSPSAPEPAPPEATLIRAYGPDGSDTSNATTANGGGDAVPAMAEPDAAAAPPPVLRGNLLCRAPVAGCYPDDVINACDPALDGGTSGADANGEFAAGCHVAPDATSVCLPGGGGMKNSSCAGPSDCAAGHECVGAGSCHRYCCSGDSECALNEFCDIQPMVQSPQTLVPVCMTKLPCTLLDSDACQPNQQNQQCGVVREDGSTSCLAVGTAMESAPCEDDHCGRGLVCLGAQGARHCAKLCYKGIFGQCKKEQNCLGALPLFLNPTVGVCQ